MEEFRRLYLADTSRLEYQDAKGKAAIHYAAAKNHTEIIWFIKERGGGQCAITFSPFILRLPARHVSVSFLFLFTYPILATRRSSSTRSSPLLSLLPISQFCPL